MAINTVQHNFLVVKKFRQIVVANSLQFTKLMIDVIAKMFPQESKHSIYVRFLLPNTVYKQHTLTIIPDYAKLLLKEGVGLLEQQEGVELLEL